MAVVSKRISEYQWQFKVYQKGGLETYKGISGEFKGFQGISTGSHGYFGRALSLFFRASERFYFKTILELLGDISSFEGVPGGFRKFGVVQILGGSRYDLDSLKVFQGRNSQRHLRDILKRIKGYSKQFYVAQGVFGVAEG